MAEVDLEVRVVRRRTSLLTQLERAIRRLGSRRLDRSLEPAAVQVGVDDVVTTGTTNRAQVGIDEQAAYAVLEVDLDATALAGVEEAVGRGVHRVVRRRERNLVQPAFAELG